MQVFGALEVAMRQAILAWEVGDYLKAHQRRRSSISGCGLDLAAAATRSSKSTISTCRM